MHVMAIAADHWPVNTTINSFWPESCRGARAVPKKISPAFTRVSVRTSIGSKRQWAD